MVSFNDRSGVPGIADDPCIVGAIAAIASLRSLSVGGSAADALNLLREVRAPSRTVEIHCANLPADYRYPAALENTLKPPRLAPTPEDLHLSSFVSEPEAIRILFNIPTQPIFVMAQYPAMRSLSIGDFQGEPRLDGLQHLFPALDGTLSLRGLHTLIGRDSCIRTRAANRRAQENNPSRAWKKLDRLRVGHAPMLYVLGLLCPIQLVIVEYPDPHIQLCYLKEALRENPVPQLKLSLSPSRLPNFDDFPSQELARTLTHLMILLVHSNENALVDVVDRDAFASLQWDDLLVRSFGLIYIISVRTYRTVIDLYRPVSFPYSNRSKASLICASSSTPPSTTR